MPGSKFYVLDCRLKWSALSVMECILSTAIKAVYQQCTLENEKWYTLQQFQSGNSGLRIPDSYDAKNSKNLQLLEILACISPAKPSFQNPTKSLFAQCSIDVKSVVTFLKYM